MSRLTIDITEQQRRSLQVMAALKGKTIGQVAIERLFPDAPALIVALMHERMDLIRRLRNRLA